jgi:hypothetical protein
VSGPGRRGGDHKPSNSKHLGSKVFRDGSGSQPSVWYNTGMENNNELPAHYSLTIDGCMAHFEDYPDYAQLVDDMFWDGHDLYDIQEAIDYEMEKAALNAE